MSLFHGAHSTITCVAVSNFIYFYTFHGLKQILVGPNAKQSASKDLVFACLSGALNVFVTNPLWVVNSKLKMQGRGTADLQGRRDGSGGPLKIKFKGLLDGLIKMVQSDGCAALWNGLAASLMLVSNPAIKFTVYEYLKRQVLKRQLSSTSLSALPAFVLGVLASSVATVATYPLQVVQVKLRHGHGYSNLSPNANTAKLFIYMIRNFGIGSLYRGLDGKLVQSLIAAGFMFLSYEKISALIFALFGLRKAIKSA
ncbi:peroxisomal membrane protein PMP34-like isoform X2 [Tigriopus californicus]|nr:peroxisomal membrane protein PMP34-like isoform X2 [Tigriopus californicus]